MRAWTRWQDWTNLVLGGVLLFAPVAFGTTGDGASSWNAYLAGALIITVAFWALAVPTSVGAQWTNVTLGSWLFIAPWLLGFADITEAAWMAWILGPTVAIMAGWAIPQAKAGGSTPRPLQDAHTNE